MGKYLDYADGVIMPMIPLERADILRQEADLVLDLIRLKEILLPYGRLYSTGSYFLDVMVYPDIDLYIPTVTIAQLFDIGAQVADCTLVTEVVFQRTDDRKRLPGGLYLKPRLKYGDWGRPWKIDLWSLPESVIQRNMDDMLHFQARMTPNSRQQIIRYKLSVMTSTNRTPVYSGYYIYKAFLDEGITDFDSITRYLISCGIEMGAGILEVKHEK